MVTWWPCIYCLYIEYYLMIKLDVKWVNIVNKLYWKHARIQVCHYYKQWYTNSTGTHAQYAEKTAELNKVTQIGQARKCHIPDLKIKNCAKFIALWHACIREGEKTGQWIVINHNWPLHTCHMWSHWSLTNHKYIFTIFWSYFIF